MQHSLVVGSFFGFGRRFEVCFSFHGLSHALPPIIPQLDGEVGDVNQAVRVEVSWGVALSVMGQQDGEVGDGYVAVFITVAGQD